MLHTSHLKIEIGGFKLELATSRTSISQFKLLGLTIDHNLNLSFPVPRWEWANTDLLSISHISKTVRVNIDFTRTFLKGDIR